MRRIFNLLAVTLALPLALAACSNFKTHTDIEALKEAEAVGSPFTQRLTAEYKAFVKSKQRGMDYADARHFARKGLMSAKGTVVMPEPLSNWHLDADSARELRSARMDLLEVLDAGGRAQAPFEAAVAQAKYDCWIEQAEQIWSTALKASCKAQFAQALSDVRERMGRNNPPSVKADEPIPAVTAPNAEPLPSAVPASIDEGMFLVFFDFDKSVLNETGLQVVDAVAEQVRTRGNVGSLRVIGHADTSGSDAYNQRLSLRRANAVKDALVKAGIDAGKISATGRGESEPMVQTPNNTREPANRRAQITFE